ncbi:MAG: hypothetical protein WCO44_00335 [Bacteroidota bacterium]
MKKLVLFSLVSLMLVADAIQSRASVVVCTAPCGIWIKFELCFHRPKLLCKSGFGICMDVTAGIDNPGPVADKAMCPVKAMINDRNQLVLEVTAEALANYEYGAALPNFKDKTAITLEEPYTLSPGTSKALGSLSPVTIKAGTYPVSFANGIYTVVFQL